MRVFVLLLLLSITLVECKDKDSDPTLDLGVDQAWLNATITDIQRPSSKGFFYIMKADYEGTCIVYVANCCPNCLTLMTYYRCDDGKEFPNVDSSKIENATTLWIPEEFACKM